MDTHELGRRSQIPGAATELRLMVRLCRGCHDKVGRNPRWAVDNGWALWSWQVGDPYWEKVAELRRTYAEAGLVYMPGIPEQEETVPRTRSQVLSARATDAELARVDELAARLKGGARRNRSTVLRLMITVALNHRVELEKLIADMITGAVVDQPFMAERTTLTGRVWGPAPKPSAQRAARAGRDRQAAPE